MCCCCKLIGGKCKKIKILIVKSIRLQAEVKTFEIIKTGMADFSAFFFFFFFLLKIETRTRHHTEDKGRLCEIVLIFDAYRFYLYFNCKKCLILVYLLINIFTKFLKKTFIGLAQLSVYVPDVSRWKFSKSSPAFMVGVVDT